MSYGYPMGSQPPPGAGGGGYGGHQQQQQQWQQPQQQFGGYMQRGQPPPPQSQHYGNYGQQFQQNVYSVNAWQAMQFQSEDDFAHLFRSKMSQRFSAIQAEELQFILNETPSIRAYYRVNWSLELCKIMIAMLDRSKDGMMQYEEFKELLQCLVFWYQTFCQYDQNRSGFIEAHEINRCFTEKFGYQVSAKALEFILKRYSRAMDDGRLLIAFDDFVSCCVRLRAYTEAFRARDKSAHGGHETGAYQFSYDDFLQCTMCL